MHAQFSFREREQSLVRFGSEQFDLLVIGGGITGAAVARDAIRRGLKVALVERRDFAFGTSSRSSKLIHGGLRYLENFELKLVFEALAERALLLRTAPHMVKPLPFYLPVYKGDRNGRFILGAGLWLYDLLTFFRTPGFHTSLSREKLLREMPFLRKEGLTGGFRYFDASMWDDVLAVETLRSAHTSGAAVANYVEAAGALWTGERVSGFRVRDTESGRHLDVHAHRVVVCAGPWTDQVGQMLNRNWQPWLNPSKGVHLIFDLKRLPVPGAMVMSQPEDGRIAFVIPRPDFGPGVVIVGTTDSPTGSNEPGVAEILPADVEYLMGLLHRYFPDLNLTHADIVSGYVGVRPLMRDQAPDGTGGGAQLQKVSREHHIGRGPGGTVLVAGGKYTTHRRMAAEIVDFTLEAWREDLRADRAMPPIPAVMEARTEEPVNPQATVSARARAHREAKARGFDIPETLYDRYGAEAVTVAETAQQSGEAESSSPDGFPMLESQLRRAIREEMVIHLEDFYFRRLPLYTALKDHGLAFARRLAVVWAEERGLPPASALAEQGRLEAEITRRSAWMKGLA